MLFVNCLFSKGKILNNLKNKNTKRFFSYLLLDSLLEGQTFLDKD